MKVLLIRPRPDPDSIGLQSFMMCEPLELEYAAAYLGRFGHQVTILDMVLERAPLEDLLRDHAPDVVGVTGYLNHVGVMKDYARRIKRHDSRCWVVVGGVHAEVEPEVFEDPDIDYVLHSDALESMRALLDGKRIGDFLPVQAARGCVHCCRFCTIYCIYRGRYFRRPVSEIIRDIRHVKSLGFRKFLLLDDNIMSDRDFMLGLCREIQKLDMRWMSQCVIDIGRDKELLAAARDSGCTLLSFGLESISRQSLEDINKGWARPEQYAGLIETITAAGIDVASEMIVGVDSDTLESLRATIDFVASTRIVAPKFYLMTPNAASGRTTGGWTPWVSGLASASSCSFWSPARLASRLYNSLVTLDQSVQAQWAQVENVYQRRADLVPNLVETVKGAAAFETGHLHGSRRGSRQGRPGERRRHCEQPRGLRQVSAGSGRPLLRALSPHGGRGAISRPEGHPEFPGPPGPAGRDREPDHGGAHAFHPGGPGLQHEAHELPHGAHRRVLRRPFQ